MGYEKIKQMHQKLEEQQEASKKICEVLGDIYRAAKKVEEEQAKLSYAWQLASGQLQRLDTKRDGVLESVRQELLQALRGSPGSQPIPDVGERLRAWHSAKERAIDDIFLAWIEKNEKKLENLEVRTGMVFKRYPDKTLFTVIKGPITVNPNFTDPDMISYDLKGTEGRDAGKAMRVKLSELKQGNVWKLVNI